MLKTSRFCAFVDDVVAKHNNEEEEKTLWDFWLHRVYDKSFVDFMRDIKPGKTTQKAEQNTDWKQVVDESREILNDFCLS